MSIPRVEFKANVPVEIALAFPEGRRVPSQFGTGEQVLYTTADGRKMWLSPFVAQKIAALKPQPGELLRITKQERTDGKRGFIWDVQKLGEQPDGTFKVPKADPAPVTEPASNVNKVQAVVSQAITVERKPPVSVVTSHCHRLIDLQAECMAYATKHGEAVSREDVRSIVLTVYIQAGRSGQLRRPVRRAG